MILIIVATDQLVWRPLIAWATSSSLSRSRAASGETSPILHLLRTRPRWRGLRQVHTLRRRANASMPGSRGRKLGAGSRAPLAPTARPSLPARDIAHGGDYSAVALPPSARLRLLRQVPGRRSGELLEGAGATFLRVNASLLIASAVDHPCRRRHRLSSPPGADRAATGSDRRFLSRRRRSFPSCCSP